MTIKEIKVRTAQEAFELLDSLPFGHLRFRGHREASWPLQSTLTRHRLGPQSSINTPYEIDEMHDHFITNILSEGLKLPFDRNNRRGRLEYARHYGVPSPLIDFSFSPYVALFFAFNGVRPMDARDADYAAIHCLDMFSLAGVWARHQSTGVKQENCGSVYTDCHNRFLYDSGEQFEGGYEIGVLKYLEMPASWNHRMQRQQGVFLYDTFNYPAIKMTGLEDFLKQPEMSEVGEEIPMLTKVLIPHKAARNIFERLDILAISATLLFGNPEGAAMDVINAYNYGRRAGRAWDVRLAGD